MRTRQPFYGDPEDAALLASMGDGTQCAECKSDWGHYAGCAREGTVQIPAPAAPPKHPDSPELPPEPQFTLIDFDSALAEPEDIAAAELEASRPVHPEYCEKGTELPLGFIPHRGVNRQQRRASVANFKAEGADRRELWQQRKRQRRGKLDPELRRLQRRKVATK